MHLLGGVRLRPDVAAPRHGGLVVLLVQVLERGAVLVDLAPEPVGPLVDAAHDAGAAADPVPLGEARPLAAMGKRAEPVEDRAAGEALALEVEEAEQPAAGEAVRDRPSAEPDPSEPGRVERLADQLLVGLGVAVDEGGAVEGDVLGLEVGEDPADRGSHLLAGVGRHQDLGRSGRPCLAGGERIPVEFQGSRPAARLGIRDRVVEPGEGDLDGAGPRQRPEQPELGQRQPARQEEDDRAPIRQQGGALGVDRRGGGQEQIAAVVELAFLKQLAVLAVSGGGDPGQLAAGCQLGRPGVVHPGVVKVAEERLERRDDRPVLGLRADSTRFSQCGADRSLLRDRGERQPALSREAGAADRLRDLRQHGVANVGVAARGQSPPQGEPGVAVGHDDRHRAERIGTLQFSHGRVQPCLGGRPRPHSGGADRHSDATRLAATGSRWVTASGAGSSTVK